ncbi:MAG TPA: hypothetical protein PKW84_07230 [Fervidobacterium sp.]|nr:hypothetical protein [Fervidobacterium sp.]
MALKAEKRLESILGSIPEKFEKKMESVETRRRKNLEKSLEEWDKLEGMLKAEIAKRKGDLNKFAEGTNERKLLEFSIEQLENELTKTVKKIQVAGEELENMEASE